MHFNERDKSADISSLSAIGEQGTERRNFAARRAVIAIRPIGAGPQQITHPKRKINSHSQKKTTLGARVKGHDQQE